MIEINKHYDEVDKPIEKEMSKTTKNAIKYGVSALVVAALLVLIVILFSRDNERDFAIEGTTTVPDVVIESESQLINSLTTDQQSCQADRSRGEQKRWPLSRATLVCENSSVDKLVYAMFETQPILDETFIQQATVLRDLVEQNGSAVRANVSGNAPCSLNSNESGEWGKESSGSNGGKFICVSTPNPKIVWTHNSSKVIGEADIENGEMDDLIRWWAERAGPI